jgi:diketogulonate reductase-like aldo/keto reductase
LTYKLSNDEQSTDPSSIKNKVESILSQLDTPCIDLVSLHSPLPGSERRISTYKTLLDLKEKGLIRAVGVCNYGLCHLKELSANGFPLPAVNQLEISPFNTHDPIVRYCKESSIQVSCAAWSKLSSVSGPVEQWAKLGELAKDKGVTKAQVLVRWALQKGFGCAPRSGTGSKLEVR